MDAKYSKKKRTARVCNQCKQVFYGDTDCLLCPACAKKSRVNNILRERVCKDCGKVFTGGPRAWRCPECRYDAEKEYRKILRKSGVKRNLGSVDACQVCGGEYVVASGRQKYCSGECRRIAVLEWQRNRKKEYVKIPEVQKARENRRKTKQKACVYCLRAFITKTTSNLCSDYCRAKQKQMKQCESDIKRGHNRDLQKLILERQEYRDMVKKSTDILQDK